MKIIPVLLVFVLTACILESPTPPRDLSVSEITLDRTSLALNLWSEDLSTFTLTANIYPVHTRSQIVWISDNNDVATVVNGLVTAIGEGSATITLASIDGSLRADCTVVVVNQEPAAVSSVALNKTSITLYLGGTNNQQTLTPVFTPLFVIDDRVTWTSSNPNVATVTNGVVTAVGAGNATIMVTTVDGQRMAACSVMVTPLLAQYPTIAAFLAAGNSFYRPGFNFGTAPTADSAANVITWVGTNTNHEDFVLNYSAVVNQNFGRAGPGNLVPEFNHQAVASQRVSTFAAGPFRSFTQFNYASVAHFAFTGYRQAHPWGIHSLSPAPSDGTGTTRAGQTWSSGLNAFAANINNVQFSGLGVDLQENKFIDTVVIYAGGNVNSDNQFNSGDPNFNCLGITLEYMPFSEAAQTAFNRLHKPNISVPTTNWNNPLADNNWPLPDTPGSPWKYAGTIVPNGTSWVYVFHFEQPVLARFLRVSFEQAPVAPPGTGFLGRVFVNSFEVYNTRP